MTLRHASAGGSPGDWPSVAYTGRRRTLAAALCMLLSIAGACNPFAPDDPAPDEVGTATIEVFVALAHAVEVQIEGPVSRRAPVQIGGYVNNQYDVAWFDSLPAGRYRVAFADTGPDFVDFTGPQYVDVAEDQVVWVSLIGVPRGPGISPGEPFHAPGTDARAYPVLLGAADTLNLTWERGCGDTFVYLREQQGESVISTRTHFFGLRRPEGGELYVLDRPRSEKACHPAPIEAALGYGPALVAVGYRSHGGVSLPENDTVVVVIDTLWIYNPAAGEARWREQSTQATGIATGTISPTDGIAPNIAPPVPYQEIWTYRPPAAQPLELTHRLSTGSPRSCGGAELESPGAGAGVWVAAGDCVWLVTPIVYDASTLRLIFRGDALRDLTPRFSRGDVIAATSGGVMSITPAGEVRTLVTLQPEQFGTLESLTLGQDDSIHLTVRTTADDPFVSLPERGPFTEVWTISEATPEETRLRTRFPGSASRVELVTDDVLVVGSYSRTERDALVRCGPCVIDHSGDVLTELNPDGDLYPPFVVNHDALAIIAARWGFDEDGGFVRSLDAINLSGQRLWSAVPPDRFQYLDLLHVRPEGVVWFGGRDSGGRTGIHTYDPISDSWAEVLEWRTEDWGHPPWAAEIGGVLMIFDPSRSALFEVLQGG